MPIPLAFTKLLRSFESCAEAVEKLVIFRKGSGAIRTACDLQIDGRPRAGRPKLTCKKLMERDCREWKLTKVDPQERSTWRSGVRSAMPAARQLPGKGPTEVEDAPAPARKSKI